MKFMVRWTRQSPKTMRMVAAALQEAKLKSAEAARAEDASLTIWRVKRIRERVRTSMRTMKAAASKTTKWKVKRIREKVRTSMRTMRAAASLTIWKDKLTRQNVKTTMKAAVSRDKDISGTRIRVFSWAARWEPEIWTVTSSAESASISPTK